MTSIKRVGMYIVLAAIFVLSINIYFAQSPTTLECSMKSSCVAGEGEIGLFSMFSDYNSHVGTINYYTNKICCKLEGKTLGTDCVAANNALIFNKFKQDDSHISVMPGYYGNDVCLSVLSVDSGQISCNVVDGNGVCATGTTCVATIYANDNSHVAGCADATTTPYTKTICCESIQLGVPEICDNNVDDDGDGDVDCEDIDCISDKNCEAECDTLTDRGALVCRIYSNCYWSYANTCKDCSSKPTCFNLGTPDDCNPPLRDSCSLNCEWNDASQWCENVNLCDDIDVDSVCDDVDNCPPMTGKPVGWNNPNQNDVDDDGIGDECDPSTINNCIPTSIVQFDIDNDGTKEEFCTEKSSDQTCSDLSEFGDECAPGWYCNDIVSLTSDGKQCCTAGCSSITILLTGETQYTLEESECRNPNDEGVGKKLVYKYSNGQLVEAPREEDCTILPDKTVSFYSTISLIITLLVLISFYAFRRKILSYFTKNKNTRRNKN